jgi:tRNA A37 threonylcarbamoyladenosine synthetase subunit TsaC/SUA5/YrdC
VLPPTPYGVGADAFDPAAVRRLLAAKGGAARCPARAGLHLTALDALAGASRRTPALIQDNGRPDLVCRQPSLQWDLGDTRGTVAVRMPDHQALRLLARTGPPRSTAPTDRPRRRTDADQAESMLGDAVDVVLDSGPSAGPVPSTIIDVTG